MNGFYRAKDRSIYATLALALPLFWIGHRAMAGTAGYVDTYAGGGPANGEKATSASFYQINAVTTDGFGDFYFATGGNQVWKADSSGDLTLIAGTGNAGFSDNVLATSADLNSLYSLALDSHGDLFIADSGNNRIRKIDHSTGIISTVTASLNSPTDIKFDSSGNLYIADGNNNQIKKLTADGGVVSSSSILSVVAGTGVPGYQDGDASGAKFINPRGLAFDASGNLFIADNINNRIRKLDASGQVSTVAGNGSCCFVDGAATTTAQLNSPSGLAFDTIGNLYIADYGNNVIRMLDPSGTTVSTVAGNGSYGYGGDEGPMSAALFNGPSSLAFDSSGNLFIAEIGNNVVRKATATSEILSPASKISTVAGTSLPSYSADGVVASVAQLYDPYGIAFDSDGNLYYADGGNNIIRKIDHATGIVATVAGTVTSGYAGDGGAATSASLSYPNGIAIDKNGNLFIADAGNSVIRMVDSGGIIHTVAGSGATDYYSNPGISPTAASLSYPVDLVFDKSGNLFIADNNNSRIAEVTANSAGLVTADSTASSCSSDCSRIYSVAGADTAGFTGDGVNAISAPLQYPYGLAFDRSGNLYIADTNNGRIRKVTADSSGSITHDSSCSSDCSQISTIAGNGTEDYDGDAGPASSAEINDPSGLAFDVNGNLYIADTDNNRIRKVTADADGVITSASVISTVTGDGSSDYDGDGGAASSAEVNGPTGMTFDTDGNLYIADTNNNRIRIVYQEGADKTCPAVTAGYGSNYQSSGKSYIRIIAQDKGSGYGAFGVTGMTNVQTPVCQEKTGDSSFVSGASLKSTNPIYLYLAKSDNALPASFTFSVTDGFGNYGAPSLSVSSLSYQKRGSVTRDFPSVAKDQGKVSILANSGDLRNAYVVANGETIPVGDVAAGTVRTVDLRSRLRDGSGNDVKVTAEGDAGAEASAMVSGATLARIDESEEAKRRVYRRGDLNEDGRVDARDATALLRMLAGLSKATTEGRALGDVNLDGRLDVTDAMALLRGIVGR